MKKISIWAKHHKWPARFAIIGGFMLLNLLGIVTGFLLKDFQFTLPPAIFFVFSLITITGFIFYPAKKLKGNILNATVFYIRRKACDFLLTVSTFCMIVFISNQYKNLSFSSACVNAATANSLVLNDSIAKNYKTGIECAKMMKDKKSNHLKWKERKRVLKTQLKNIRKADDLSKGEKIALIIFSIAVAVGLGILLAALACNIACSGAEGLAILVAIAGFGLIALLLTISIKAIVGKGRKGKEKTDNDKQVIEG
jgi:hypothetical protein